jgi:hypothetical protein
MNRTEYINEYVEGLGVDEPLYTDDLARSFAATFGIDETRAKKTVNVYLKRLADKGILARMRRGMYGRIFDGVFGKKAKPNATAMAHQLFLRDDSGACGYEAGPTLLNALGLSTLLPHNLYIATNRHRYKVAGRIDITVMKPLEHVNDGNVRYLQIIEAVRAIGKYGAEGEDADRILCETIAGYGLDPVVLLSYAYKHCTDSELRRIVGLAVKGKEKNEAA